MIDEEPPVTAGDLHRWSGGLDTLDAARAEVAIGLDVAEFGTWARRRKLAATTSAPNVRSGFLSWSVDAHRLEANPDGVIAIVETGVLAIGTDPDKSFLEVPVPLRLALRGPALPIEVVPRLLRAPGVGSVVIPVQRPPGALRRRAWEWPMRLGTVDEALADKVVAAGPNRLPPELLDVVDIRHDPGTVDILVLRESVDDVIDIARTLRPVANIVVIAGAMTGGWPITDAAVTMIRALTGAVAVVIAPAATESDALALCIVEALRYLSHGHMLDVSFTAAFNRDVIIVAELEALDEMALPQMFRERAHELRADLAAVEDFAVREANEAEIVSLELVAEGHFDAEHRQASEAPRHEHNVTSAIDESVPERELQLRVRSSTAERQGTPDNALRIGVNEIDIFVGPREVSTLLGLAMTNDQLGFTASSLVVRLTAVLVPLSPEGEPVRAEFDVPRTGRSQTATLAWTIPPGVRRAEARVMVLHRNRVIQTAVLSGNVRSGAARLTERVVLWKDFGHLDDRRPFDMAIILNHDGDGKARAIGHSNGRTDQIVALPELDDRSDRIRRLLIKAAFLKGSEVRSDAARKLLVDVAVEGRALGRLIRSGLTACERAERIQIITARPTWFLPLEFVYDREAPDDDAVMCERWLDGKECGNTCFPDGDEPKVVCPSAFWGMSRIIERHWVDAVDSTATSFLVGASPKRRRRRLPVDGAVVAASRKVTKAQLAATAAVLGQDTVVAHGWSEWEEAIRDAATANLLVLMPHTDAAADTMEISKTALRSGRVEPKRHVTGGRDSHPVVVLFGCDATGSRENPAGYATLFMRSEAGVVFATHTMLLNAHAAELSQRLIASLRDAQRPTQPIGDLVRSFRREAVRDGLLAALAVTAYGDSDWNV